MTSVASIGYWNDCRQRQTYARKTMNLSVMLAVVGEILVLACSNAAPNTANTLR